MSLLYLIASLPFLNVDAAPVLSPSKFEELCRQQLGEAASAAAVALLRGEPTDHPLASAWSDAETILRNAVTRRRARLRGADGARWLRPTRGCDRQIEEGVEAAFEAGDPLKRERALDELRWRVADALAGPDPLSLGVVFAYAVKLAIAVRRASLDKARGQATFDKLAAFSPALSPPTPNS
jgi:hypothetical protein